MKTFIAVEIHANPGGERRMAFEFDPTAVIALSAVSDLVTGMYLSTGLLVEVCLPIHDLRNRILYVANPRMAPT